MLALHEGVSEDTLRLRFFSPSPAAGRAYVAKLFDEANHGSVALVAELRGRIAALATGELLSQDRAEVAFLVSDQDRGRGLGSLLLEHLAAVCREHGVTRFEAEVLADNYGMLGVFRAAGFAATRRTEDGEVSVELRTEVSPAAIDAADRREWRSEARSLRPLLYPESVAVVGVRRTAAGLGNSVLEAIREGGFTGRLYAVHPEADSVAGLPAHRTLAAIGEPIDLVVVVVPAGQVTSVMADAAAAGVGAAIVVSSGFGHPDGLGAADERELLRTARAHSVRVVGPDSQGVLSQGPEVRLNATFARALPGPGGLAIASQSGGVGFTLLDLARDQGVGVHSFVSLGAKLDVSSNDLLAAWMDDDAGRRRRTPPGVLRQRAQVRPDCPPLRGAQAPVRRPRGPVDGLGDRRRRPVRPGGRDPVPERHRGGRDGGAAAGQPLPAGYRVGVVTNAGGMGMLVADLADAEGLSVPELSGEGQAAVHDGGARTRSAPATRSTSGRTCPQPRWRRGLRALLAVPELDAVVVVLVPTSLAEPRRAVRSRSPGPGQQSRAPGPARRLRRSRPRSPRRGDRLPDRGGSGGGAGAHDEVRRMAAGPGRGPSRCRWASGPPSPRAWAVQRLAARGGTAEWLPGSGERRAAGCVRHRTRRHSWPEMPTGPAGPRRRSASRSW